MIPESGILGKYTKNKSYTFTSLMYIDHRILWNRFLSRVVIFKNRQFNTF